MLYFLKMRHLLKILLLIALVGPTALAQKGNYFLSHYNPEDENISYLSFDIEQDDKGVLYFSNRSGVLQFDGRSWSMITVNGAVYDLTVANGGRIFAGGTEGFGRLVVNQENRLSYESLSDSLTNSRNIFSTIAREEAIYFMNEKNIFTYDSSGRVARILTATAAQGNFTGLFEIQRELYAGTELAGLQKVSGQTLSPANVKGLPAGQVIFTEKSPDGARDLIAFDDNRLFIMGSQAIEFKPRDTLFFSNSVLANAVWITQKQIAVGTLRGGVSYFDIETGETLDVTNFHTGLPDNEVYALHVDRHQGVWIAHDYGFTRAAPFLPFRTFNHYRGLAGNLLCVQSVGDKVYVGTSLGLFMLSREEIYEDESYVVMVKVKSKSKPTTQTAAPVEPETRKEKKGLLGIFRKKKVPPPEPVTTAKPVRKQTVQTKGVTKTRKVLRGVEYVYKPVQGVSGKVDQLLLVGDRLICSGVGGVHEVKDLVATPILLDPAHTIYYSKNLRQLLVSTYADEVMTFRSSGKEWARTEFPDSLSGYADYFFEDNLQDLWICGRDKAIKIGIEEGEILDAEMIPLPHASIERTVGIASGNDVYLTQNGEFYHYAAYKNAFVKNDSLPGPKKYFASAGYFWFYDGHRWRTIDPRRQGALKTEWLGVFPDVRFLGPAVQGKSLWIITTDNELYKFSSEWEQNQAYTNPLFLKEVRTQRARFSPKQGLVIDERESSITLEFIQPEYVSLQAVEYRYFVKGLQKNWTEWSSMNNIIAFPFLPSGSYTVQVQAKDLFGRITELAPVDFNVVPPYWKRPWFYALEFLVFGILVVLSLRLNADKIRYRYLSRFLSALTIIMLIQFIQTIVTAYITFKSTPVAEFFVQVSIALLVLPVEEFLRKSIMRADAMSH